MGKFAALLVLVTVASMIYFFKPQTQVAINERSSSQPLSPSSVPTMDLANPANQKGQTLPHTHDAHTDHQHDQQIAPEIPEFIQQSLEAKRVPISELKEEDHPDGGKIVNLKGQYRHVPIAIINEDGSTSIIEATIKPLPDRQ
jgi:hypothetical protein